MERTCTGFRRDNVRAWQIAGTLQDGTAYLRPEPYQSPALTVISQRQFLDLTGQRLERHSGRKIVLQAVFEHVDSSVARFRFASRGPLKYLQPKGTLVS